MYVRCKLCNMKMQTIQKISFKFREKIQNFRNVNILGVRFNRSGTPFFDNFYFNYHMSNKVNFSPFFSFEPRCALAPYPLMCTWTRWTFNISVNSIWTLFSWYFGDLVVKVNYILFKIKSTFNTILILDTSTKLLFQGYVLVIQS